jgi:hypothetical protein
MELNDEEKKHDAKNNNPKKCLDGWGKRKQETINTKDINKLQWWE